MIQWWQILHFSLCTQLYQICDELTIVSSVQVPTAGHYWFDHGRCDNWFVYRWQLAVVRSRSTFGGASYRRNPGAVLATAFPISQGIDTDLRLQQSLYQVKHFDILRRS